MIQKFVDRFMAKKEETIKAFMEKAPDGYESLFYVVVNSIRDEDEYETPDPGRITVIDDGDYQGNRLFVVGASGYQPRQYWACIVAYGSCSGCDSFEAIRGYAERVSEKEAKELWTLCLHMVQSLKSVTDN